MPIYSQHQFLISWASPRMQIDSEPFETFSGYEETVEANEHYDGGALDPEIWFDRVKRANSTFGRAFRVPRDVNLVKLASTVMGSGEKGTLTVQPLDRDMAVDGEPLVITAHIVGVKSPSVDAAAAGSKAMVEITVRPIGLAK